MQRLLLVARQGVAVHVVPVLAYLSLLWHVPLPAIRTHADEIRHACRRVTVAADDHGVFWLWDAEGKKFFSLGVNAVEPGSPHYSPHDPKYSALRFYGSEKSWAAAALRRLCNWKFNTLGGWSDKTTMDGTLLSTPVLHLGAHFSFPWTDALAEQFADNIDRRARQQITPWAGDPQVLGWFSDNEPGWFPEAIFEFHLRQYRMEGRRVPSLLSEQFTSGNGLTIVGWGTVLGDVREAMIWDPMLTSGTMMSLRDYLVNEQGLGTQLTGWTLQEAQAISDDGRVIVGVGINPMGQTEAFRAQIDLASMIDGDFNDDGVYDCADVNLLSTAVATSGSVSTFDLNGDGSLTLGDVDSWRAEAGENNLGPGRVYTVADANLDGNTDGSDFGRWNSSKFTNNTNYCDGNFNADAVVDGSDFGLWNSSKFTSADSTSLVPEPAIVSTLSLLAMYAALRRLKSDTNLPHSL